MDDICLECLLTLFTRCQLCSIRCFWSSKHLTCVYYVKVQVETGQGSDYRTYKFIVQDGHLLLLG